MKHFLFSQPDYSHVKKLTINASAALFKAKVSAHLPNRSFVHLCLCGLASLFQSLPCLEVKNKPGFSFQNYNVRTEIPWRFPEKLTGRITAKDSRATTVMSSMMWRWKDRYVTASTPHLLRISSSLDTREGSESFRTRNDALKQPQLSKGWSI